MKYDIVIVGAGIAGLSSALHLSNSSRKILVMEKAIFPRDKPCGGGLTYKSINLLDEIGFKYSFDDISEVNFNYYNEIINYFKRRKGILRIVKRIEFDKDFYSHAKNKGINIVENIAISSIEYLNHLFYLHTNIGIIESKALIGADGSNSFIRKQFKINVRGKAFALMIDEIKSQNKVSSAIYDFAYIKSGYAWTFPFQGRLNMGIYTLDKVKGIKDLLTKYIKYKSSCKVVDKNKIKGKFIPFGGYFPKKLNLPLILVGDAGGFCDPTTGEGIYQALFTGKCAALSFKKSIRFGSGYFLLFSLKIQIDTFVTYYIHRIFYNHLRGALFFLRKEFIYRMLIEGSSRGAVFFQAIVLGPYYYFRSKFNNSIEARFYTPGNIPQETLNENNRR